MGMINVNVGDRFFETKVLPGYLQLIMISGVLFSVVWLGLVHFERSHRVLPACVLACLPARLLSCLPLCLPACKTVNNMPACPSAACLNKRPETGPSEAYLGEEMCSEAQELPVNPTREHYHPTKYGPQLASLAQVMRSMPPVRLRLRLRLRFREGVK